MRAKQIASRKKLADLCLANNDGKGRKSETWGAPGQKQNLESPKQNRTRVHRIRSNGISSKGILSVRVLLPMNCLSTSFQFVIRALSSLGLLYLCGYE